MNFGFVPARNQVIFVSFFSMVWSTFMAYVQHLETKRSLEKNLEQKKSKKKAVFVK